jgi:preprotein translocase subunit SecA
MSFINSIIKVFVGDKSQKMSKFTTVLNKIKTFETQWHYRMRSTAFFKDRIKTS